MNSPETFVEELSSVELSNTFNPYRDVCPLHDRDDAAALRRENLRRCIEAAIKTNADTMWVARDLGYRGGRRTGVPLTDEAHLPNAERLFGGVPLFRATKGQVVAERTATVTWNLLSEIERSVMLWNVFPFHPYVAGDPMTNRCHKKAEREATWHFLTALVEMIKPVRIIAIGRDAGLALAKIETQVETVRHPSYGGQTDFIAGIRSIYQLRAREAQSDAPRLPFMEFA